MKMQLMSKSKFVLLVITLIIILAMANYANKKHDKPIFCGGIAGVACPAGYMCQIDGMYPDAGGECIRQN